MTDDMTIQRNDPFPVLSCGRMLHCFAVTGNGPVRYPLASDAGDRSAPAGNDLEKAGLGSSEQTCVSVGLYFENGVLTITHTSTGLLHLVCAADSDLEYQGELWERALRADPAYEPSFAYDVPPSPAGDMRVTSTDAGVVEITAGVYQIRVSGSDAALSIHDLRDGHTLLATRSAVFTSRRSRIGMEFAINRDERVFGAGERMGFLDKRGKRYLNWNTDDPFIREVTDPLYQSVPFLVRWQPGGRSAGIFHDYPGVSWMDVDSTGHNSIRLHQAEERMSLFLCAGPTFADVIGQYTLLTGTMMLPPKWALGFHQSRYSYRNEAEVYELVAGFRKRSIALDAVYLDIHYMDEYRVFTWDRDAFPDPSSMIERLAAEGVRVITIVDPGVKADSDYHVYRDGLARDVFARRSSGEVYHGEVWPGRAVFPDFTAERAREFWADHHKSLLGAGVSGIWNDMNEPADFVGDELDRIMFTPPLDVVLEGEGRPKGHMHYHNGYALKMAEATHAAFEKHRPGERPFLLTRAGYAGVQKYAAIWNGDIDSSWHHLAQSIPMFLNMGVSGLPFVGSDIGGFQSDATPELYARWMQFAVFTPYMRAHSAVDTGPHEPWCFGSTVEDVARESINLRYRLLPYIYSVFAGSAETGLPVMSPMVLHWPHDERCSAMWDQFMFGPSLMVAPIVYPDQRKRLVTFPEGSWYNFYTGEQLQGPAEKAVEAPFERIPVYVRGGSVVPMQRAVAHSGDSVTEIELHCFPASDDSVSSFVFHEDDGITRVDADGYEYRRTSMSMRGRELVIECSEGRYQSAITEFVVYRAGVQIGRFAAGGNRIRVVM